MEPPKISFGFSKVTKKTNIISSKIAPEERKVDLIECLEGQSIKVKDAVEEVKEPLVIPLKDNKKNLLDRIKEFKKKEEAKKTLQERPDSELTPDELVARQLIKEAQERLANGTASDNSKVSVLPLSKDVPELEGEKEPTLEDYESVPISDYGLALLRGMGWKEGMAIGKNVSQSAVLSIPELRPKGLGLGATKVVQSEMPSKKATDKDGNELILKRGVFAKVIVGNQKGNYCEVQGFDEDAGRVIIKVYPRGEIININELMLVPVTKEEFSKGSKIINNAKYEEYKEMSDKRLDEFKIKSESSQRHIKKEEPSSFSESEESDHRSHRGCKKEKSHRKHRERSSERDCKRGSSSSSKYRERSNSPPKHKKSERSDKHSHKGKHKKDRRSRSRSKERSYSSKHKSKSKHRSPSDSSDDSRDKKYHNRSKYN